MTYYLDSAVTGLVKLDYQFLTQARQFVVNTAITAECTTRMYQDWELIAVFNAGCGCVSPSLPTRGQDECLHNS